MNPFESLSDKPYYSNHQRKFAHYYDVYYTNIDKIDGIMINSLQKGFKPQQVILKLDEIWNNCIQREKEYLEPDGKPVTAHEQTFELYLRNVLRKILVFDEFDSVFSGL